MLTNQIPYSRHSLYTTLKPGKSWASLNEEIAELVHYDFYNIDLDYFSLGGFAV